MMYEIVEENQFRIYKFNSYPLSVEVRNDLLDNNKINVFININGKNALLVMLLGDFDKECDFYYDIRFRTLDDKVLKQSYCIVKKEQEKQFIEAVYYFVVERNVIQIFQDYDENRVI